MTSPLSLSVLTLTQGCGADDRNKSVALEPSTLLAHPEHFGEFLLLEFATKFGFDVSEIEGAVKQKTATDDVPGDRVNLYYFDDSTLTVVKGNKEYQGRREVLAKPYLVVSMQGATSRDGCPGPETQENANGQETVCLVHSIIREKIVFSKNPVHHFT